MKPRYKLRDLNIDRVDLVDRGANQYAEIIIVKSDDEDKGDDDRSEKTDAVTFGIFSNQLKNGAKHPSYHTRTPRKKKKAKGSATPERNAAESSQGTAAPLTKHASHDQDTHGNRDGGGSGDSSPAKNSEWGEMPNLRIFPPKSYKTTARRDLNIREWKARKKKEKAMVFEKHYPGGSDHNQSNHGNRGGSGGGKGKGGVPKDSYSRMRALDEDNIKALEDKRYESKSTLYPDRGGSGGGRGDSAADKKTYAMLEQAHKDWVASGRPTPHASKGVPKGKPSFDDWMNQVDSEVSRRAGLSIHDLADQPFRDMYDSGRSAKSVASKALKDEGFGGKGGVPGQGQFDLPAKHRGREDNLADLKDNPDKYVPEDYDRVSDMTMGAHPTRRAQLEAKDKEARMTARYGERGKKNREYRRQVIAEGGRKTPLAPTGPRRPISEIASEIRRDWGSKVNYGAKPYLSAMGSLDKISDNYGQDSADSVIRYFLGNAKTWRGETARKVKAELNDMLKNPNPKISKADLPPQPGVPRPPAAAAPSPVPPAPGKDSCPVCQGTGQAIITVPGRPNPVAPGAPGALGAPAAAPPPVSPTSPVQPGPPGGGGEGMNPDPNGPGPALGPGYLPGQRPTEAPKERMAAPPAAPAKAAPPAAKTAPPAVPGQAPEADDKEKKQKLADVLRGKGQTPSVPQRVPART